MTDPNENSTCEWVDEAYSRRLWARLVKQAEAIPPLARRSLLTVRAHAHRIWKEREGRHHYWSALTFKLAPFGALDFTMTLYDRNGRFKEERVALRISQHAGQRLFERLRTNSEKDLIETLGAAILVLVKANGPLIAGEFDAGTETEACLPWGTLHLVADGGGWVAKTFIPMKPL